ncbi:hypothetical protein CJ030_MR7G008078 [Morella rubra]|uniref:Uncharacterized protein n=1 Tax=Morella rubra TaxID=262757 RepID=A0A6A1V458_9ROSI|nr:hypothetical protein CJ030_MR7G008078 [Morella rubra]
MELEGIRKTGRHPWVNVKSNPEEVERLLGETSDTYIHGESSLRSTAGFDSINDLITLTVEGWDRDECLHNDICMPLTYFSHAIIELKVKLGEKNREPAARRKLKNYTKNGCFISVFVVMLVYDREYHCFQFRIKDHCSKKLICFMRFPLKGF